MSHTHRAMQQLRAALVQRSDRIRRGAHLTGLHFGPASVDRFDVIMTWVDRQKKEHTLTRAITRQMAFDYHGTRAPRLRQSPCRFADDLIRAVLRERGVIR